LGIGFAPEARIALSTLSYPLSTFINA